MYVSGVAQVCTECAAHAHSAFLCFLVQTAYFIYMIQQRALACVPTAVQGLGSLIVVQVIHTCVVMLNKLYQRVCSDIIANVGQQN
jgi:hypothetical protein